MAITSSKLSKQFFPHPLEPVLKLVMQEFHTVTVVLEDMLGAWADRAF